LLDENGALVRTLPLPIFAASSYAVSAAGQTFAIAWTDTKLVTAASPAPPPTVGRTTLYLQRYDDAGEAIAERPFFLHVAAGQQSNAKGPCPTRGQHVPGRIADHDGVFDLGPETVDRRQEKVGIRLSILDLIARHYGD